jgi:hypothetical protein
MIRRGADEGEAKGDVHPASEGERLENSHPDVVIGDNDRVSAPVHKGEEGRVRRERTSHLHASFTGGIDGGCEDESFLVSEEAPV